MDTTVPNESGSEAPATDQVRLQEKLDPNLTTNQKPKASPSHSSEDSPAQPSHQLVSDAVSEVVDSNSLVSISRQELLKLMEGKKDSKPLHLHWIHFIDSGGQPQFIELLQAFIRNTSIVMIVLKLSESLEKYPEIAYYDRQTGQRCGETYTSNLRNHQIIQRCIRTLSRDKDCRVLVVGTHLDLAHSSPESIEEKNVKLSKILRPALGYKLVMRSPNEVAFPMNAKTPGKEDHKVAADIRGEIAKDKHLSQPYKVPIAWFLLEQDLQKLGKSVISLRECYRQGAILEMDKATVDAALDYFTELNIILYYPSVLPNVVFVSPQVIVDKVTELIEFSFYLRGRPESEVTDSEEKWKSFTECGEVSISVLSEPRFLKHYDSSVFNPHDLILVFQHLFIVAPFSNLTYFMPSLLPEIVAEELDEHRPPMPLFPAVLLHFPDGCVPSGTFCCLSVYLISNCGWNTAEKVYRNCIKFLLDDDHCAVTIIDAFEFLEVHLENAPNTSPNVFPKILKSIRTGLTEANSALRQEEVHYQLALKCPGSVDGEHEPSTHAAVVSESNWTCTKNPKITGELSKYQAIWFSRGQQETKTTQTVQAQLLHKSSQTAEQLQEMDTLRQENQQLRQQLKLQQVKASEEDKMKLNLPGAQLVSRGTLIIERSDRLQTLEWENHGLKIHVPPSALPESEDTCEIEVATTFSGSFVLPQDHTFVSPIFYIEPNKTLNKPLTIEMEHCCLTETENDVKSLVPIHALSSNRKPPYEFQPLNNGTFTVGSFWGSFEVSTFSWFSFSWFPFSFWSKTETSSSDDSEEEFLASEPPTSQEDGASKVQPSIDPPAVYSGRIYYRPEDSNRWFIVKLLVFPNLVECREAVEKRYSARKKWMEMMSSFSIRFLTSSQDFSLLIDESGVVKEGWEIAPCRIPLRISRQDIHNPKTMEYYDPANCELSVMWTKENEAPRNLKYYIDMQGVDIKRLLITLNPNKIARSISSEVKLEITPTQGILEMKDHYKVSKTLKELPTPIIIELGQALGLSRPKMLKMADMPGDMIEAWLRQEDEVIATSGVPTWSNLAEALEEIGQGGAARKIRDRFLHTPT